MSAKLKAVTYDPITNKLTIIDQRALPNELKYLTLSTQDDIFLAIRNLAVRGAPAIGVTAAFGMAMLGQQLQTEDPLVFLKRMASVCECLRQARPTARNLFTSLEQMMLVIQNDLSSVKEMKKALIYEALRQEKEDETICKAIGQHGAQLLSDHDRVMTYCNAGALATSNGYGTALAPVYVAQEAGMDIHVLACETRPVLQGARLTAYELASSNIDVTVMTDGMIASYLRQHSIKAIFVGADCIALNGDVANKIGTLGLAIIAQSFHIPFYVCAPSTTMDIKKLSGEDIPIEMRSASEVRNLWYKQSMITEQAHIYNPSFDVTPSTLITGIITEDGIFQAPYDFRRYGHA